jgi:hypothetical protein
VKLGDIALAEQLKQQNKARVEEITQLQENTLLPLCLAKGNAWACDKLVELDEEKRRCQGGATAASGQSNVPAVQCQDQRPRSPRSSTHCRSDARLTAAHETEQRWI